VDTGTDETKHYLERLQMHQSLINSPSLRVLKRTGTEGGRHDPWVFHEYEIRKGGGLTLTIHEGLTVWVLHEGCKTYLRPTGDEDGVARSRLDAFTVAACGYTIDQLERFARKARSRCKCGCNRFEEIKGYPGEALHACLSCHRIAYSTYNESAVA
jgi:hypothetical protein